MVRNGDLDRDLDEPVRYTPRPPVPQKLDRYRGIIQTRTTTAVITHNAAISAMADRVIRMRSGRIAEVVRNASRARPGDLQW
jgi:putative ABC transport system ATP-binding protein